MTNNTAPRLSLSDKIAARVVADFTCPNVVLADVVEELTRMARAKKMSAPKLSPITIENVITRHTANHEAAIATPKVEPSDEMKVAEAEAKVARAGRGTRKCSDCGITITKKNRVTHSHGFADMCTYCYDAAATFNEHQDGQHEDEKVNDCEGCGTLNRPKPQAHSSHDECDHEKTPAARAKCRKARAAQA